MTQEEKQILIIDISARMFYGVICDMWFEGNESDKITEVLKCGGLMRLMTSEYNFIAKPYLRPMSSMTEEEKKEFDEVIKLCNNKVFACPEKERRYKFFDAEQEDFMNAHHFDYRIVPSTGKTMIESNLAIEAPEDMYKQIIHGKE